MLTVCYHASLTVHSLLRVSRLKGVSDDASISFQAAGGLYHIIGNHEQVLVSASLCLSLLHGAYAPLMQSDTIRKNFDKPLRQHLQAYRQQIAVMSPRCVFDMFFPDPMSQDRSAAYEQSLVEKNRLIRRVEMENMNIGRRRQRGELSSQNDSD